LRRKRRLVLLDQDTDGARSWSLPGGRVEPGETLAPSVACCSLTFAAPAETRPALTSHSSNETSRAGLMITIAGPAPPAATRPFRGFAAAPATRKPIRRRCCSTCGRRAREANVGDLNKGSMLSNLIAYSKICTHVRLHGEPLRVVDKPADLPV
jgi:hypothetical protein